MKSVKLAVSAFALIAASASVASARDQVQVSGSSTVLPYATIVAEAFAENTDFAARFVICFLFQFHKGTIKTADLRKYAKQFGVEYYAEQAIEYALNH